MEKKQKTTQDLRKELTQLGNDYDRYCRILNYIDKAYDLILVSEDSPSGEKALEQALYIFNEKADKCLVEAKKLIEKIKRLENK